VRLSESASAARRIPTGPDVLARSGRPQEAEKEFLEELRLYPDRIDARVSLAALYASVDRRKDARRVVIELVSRQPTPESFLLGMRTLHSTEDPEGEARVRREAKRLFPKDPRFAAAATSSSAGASRSR